NGHRDTRATSSGRRGSATARLPATTASPSRDATRTPTHQKESPVRYTITEALHEMRRLQGADAGRLRGVEVQYHLDELTDLDRLPAPWGSRLVDLIEARKAGTITADTPHYLVYSDLCRGRHKSDYAEPPVMPRPARAPALERDHRVGNAA